MCFEHLIPHGSDSIVQSLCAFTAYTRMADIKELHSCRETSWRSSSKYNSSEGYTYKGYRLIDWLIDWYNSGRYTYSQRVSSAGLTSVVITSPTSPVLSSLPVNHSKHDTNRPTMMTWSPCSRLSSSGPPASYSTVAMQEPVASMGRGGYREGRMELEF